MNIDSAAIFSKIDLHGFGYITTSKLVDWLAEEVGFVLHPTERLLIQSRYGRRSPYEITAAEFMDQVQAIPGGEEEENPENYEDGGEELGDMGGEDMMDDRDSDAYMGGEDQHNQIEEYEKKIREAQRAAGIEDSAEEEPVEMKGRYNATADGHAAILNQADDEEESPAAGSESHKYLGGFEDENDEDMD